MNYEYSSPHIKGSTLTGSWGRLIGEYYPNEKLRIQVGANALKYIGSESYAEVSEWFSVVYQPISSFRFIFGNLNNTANFGLPNPLYNSSLFITKPSTKGLQAEFTHKRIDTKTWIEWERFIQIGDPFQEIFTFGLTADLKLTDTASSFTATIPICFLARHHGGEIDSSSDSIETIANPSIGIHVGYKTGFWNISVTPQYLIFNEVTDNYRQPFSKGNAFYVEGQVNYKQLKIGLDYWFSHRFFSPHGHPTFQSYNAQNPNTIFNQQHLLFGRIEAAFKIGKIAKLLVEGDYWYDLARSKNNFSTGLKLIITDEFFVKKLKQKHE